jgi:hypothetical protein
MLEKHVSEKYFGHKRFSSFLRQLSNHGYKHITAGKDRNSYYHECMLRGLPHLIQYMPKPRDARRLIPDPDNEPNFYAITKQYPLPDDPNVTLYSFDEEEATREQPVPPAVNIVPPLETLASVSTPLLDAHRLSSVMTSPVGQARVVSQSGWMEKEMPPAKRTALMPLTMDKPMMMTRPAGDDLQDILLAAAIHDAQARQSNLQEDLFNLLPPPPMPSRNFASLPNLMSSLPPRLGSQVREGSSSFLGNNSTASLDPSQALFTALLNANAYRGSGMSSSSFF